MKNRPGRPPKGLDHIDKLDAPEDEKTRLRAVLQVLAGEIPLREAAQSLGMSESRFHELREQVLNGAVQGLAPRPAGRPPKVSAPGEAESEAAALREEVEQLKLELLFSEARTMLALTRGELPEGELEKGGPETRQERRIRERMELRQRKRGNKGAASDAPKRG